MKKQKNLFTLTTKPKTNKVSLFKRMKKQRFISIPAEDFENEIVRTTDGKFKTVIQVTDPVNLDLLDEKGITQVIKNIQTALNTLSPGQRCQILISSDEVDISKYLNELEQKEHEAMEETEFLKGDLLKGKRDFLKEYTLKAKNSHNFYVVLETNEKDYENAMSELYDLTKSVIESLKKGNGKKGAGMNAIRLKEDQIKKSIYNKLSPSSNKTFPYEPGMDMTAWQPPDIEQGSPLKMDDYLYSFYTLSYFPKIVEPGWIDNIINARVNLDMSINLESIDKGDQVTKIDGQIKELGTRLLNKLPTSLKRKYENEIESLERLIDRMQDDSENLFNTTFILAVKEKEAKKLESACKRLETQIKSNRMKAKKIIRNKYCLWYTLPLGYKNEDIEKRYGWPMYAELLGAMVPFNSSELNENTGVLKGINVKSEAPIIYDSWNRKMFNNSNETILGESGSGKSFNVETKVLREYYSGKSERQFVIDPEREYTNFPGANRIVFKPGSEFVTNPFHIRSTVVDSDDEKFESTRIKDYLPTKISGLITFFKWIVTNMDDLEQSLLLECIEMIYSEFGLSLNKNVEQLPNVFPTLSDLDKVMSTMPEMKRVKSILRPFISGVYSGIFNGQTNWNLNAEINVLDIHELDETVRKPYMDLLLKDLWEEVKKNRKEKVGLYADELWILSDPKNPQAMEFMFSIAKRIRKYSGFLCVATQNVADFLAVGRYGTAIINNAQIKTLMNLSGNDIRELEKNEILNFSEGEREILEGDKPQGYCLHIVRGKRVEMRTLATPDEQTLLGLELASNDFSKEEIKDHEREAVLV